MDPINILFQLFSLGIVTLWAARLAKGRNRSPYLWGGAALILSVFPLLIPGFGGLQILGVLPIVGLMIMQPVSRSSRESASNRFCPYCGSSQTPTYNTVGEANTSIEWICTGCDKAVTEFLAPIESTKQPTQTSVPDSIPEESVETVSPQELISTESKLVPSDNPEVQPEDSIIKKPNFVPSSLTAEVFTTRGKTLLDQNKFTEAVDQFTKALAMDNSFVQALTYRIQAYQHLGHPELAEKDQAVLGSLT